MAKSSSIDGRVVLVVQRGWFIASILARAFEANGAKVLLATNSSSGLGLVGHPLLSAAVLDSDSRELCRLFEARGVPFLFYTGCARINDEFDTAPVIRKPAHPAEVVHGVERLLTQHD